MSPLDPTLPEGLAASGFVLLAVAHSILGETDILRPLFAAQWETELPRWGVERILRFAWHVTSIAWLGLAALILDAPLLATIGVVALTSALLVFVMLRGHLAWPLFLLAGLAAFQATQPLSDGALSAASAATVAGLLIAAGVHAYWALGGEWGFDVAIPTDADGQQPFTPTPALTLLVAGALLGAAAVVGAVAWGPEAAVLRWGAVVMTVVLTIRAIGDTKVAGFTKVVRETKFAHADDHIFTPLCVFLALGTTAALML